MQKKGQIFAPVQREEKGRGTERDGGSEREREKEEKGEREGDKREGDG